MKSRILLLGLLFGGMALPLIAQPKTEFIKKGSREESIRATLKAHHFPNLEGKWHWIGPFDNTEKVGFDTAYPPEKGIDLKKKYPGKNNKEIGWNETSKFELGKVFNLASWIPQSQNTVIYLYHEIEVSGEEAMLMPLMLGSDDRLWAVAVPITLRYDGDARQL